MGKKRGRKGEKGAETTLCISSPSFFMLSKPFWEKRLKGTVSCEP
jgi:hypothetical protein